MKNILILGGTQFLGRRVVERLEHREDLRLVLANRGRSNPELFPGIERISFQREGDDPACLNVRDWDAVIDFSAYYPTSFSRLLESLKGRVGRYVFISTLSVFDFESLDIKQAITEETPTLSCTAEQAVDKTMMTYGARKAECERILQSADWLSGTSLRPSIIYGRYDWTERFYYWLYRVATNRSFILPGGGADIGSFSELEDLCAMIESCAELKHVHPLYNTTTHDPLSFSDFIRELQRSEHKEESHSTAVAVSWEQCLKHGINPGSDMPMCFGISMNIDNSRILRDSGLQCRPLSHAFKVELQRARERSMPLPVCGLSLEKEDQVLKALRS